MQSGIVRLQSLCRSTKFQNHLFAPPLSDPKTVGFPILSCEAMWCPLGGMAHARPCTGSARMSWGVKRASVFFEMNSFLCFFCCMLQDHCLSPTQR